MTFGKILSGVLAAGCAFAALSCPLLSGGSASSGAAVDAGLLMPSPKNAKLGGTAILANRYSLDDSAYALPADLRKWLTDELERKLGMAEAPAGKTKCVIKTSKLDASINKEIYTLDVASGRIAMGAASQDGLARAVGRLLCVVDSPLVKLLPDGSAQFPEMSIKDWPDFPMRGMHLQMAYNVRESVVKDEIDAMAKLGFNYVVFEIGGRFESLSHPECCIKPWWTRAQLKGLVAYARSRGLTAVPAFNSIGHLDRAPQVFIIKKKDESGKLRPVVMDISNPEFYNVYFSLMDEVVELFGNPPYFHVGTDEFSQQGKLLDGAKVLQEVTGKSGPAYYSEFLNKVKGHLAEKGSKMVMWHDMLSYSHPFNGEPANGALTHGAADLIDKDIVIDYWSYEPLDKYGHLEALAAKGNEMWVSPWLGADAITRLCSDGAKLGAKGVLGTTWCDFPAAESFVQTAEAAWLKAPSPKSNLDIERMAAALFSGRGTKVPAAGISQMEVGGVTQPSSVFMGKLASEFPRLQIDASGVPFSVVNPKSAFAYDWTPPEPLSMPLDAAKISQLKEKSLLVACPGKSEWMAIDGVNKIRNYHQSVIYTSEFGASTRTNEWGIEWGVDKDGRIVDRSVKGNMEIPAGGYVISVHGGAGMPPCGLLNMTRPGDKLVVLERNLKAPSVDPITVNAQPGAKGVIIFLTAEYGVDKLAPLAKVALSLSDGSNVVVDLKGSALFQADNKAMSGNWKPWLVWRGEGVAPILAMEWNSGKGQPVPLAATVTPAPEGVQSGLVVLGGVQR